MFNITDRYRVALLFSSIFTFSTAITAITVVSNSIPCPEVLLIKNVNEKYSRTHIKDPNFEIILQNNGGGSMFINSIKIFKNNKEEKSFDKAFEKNNSKFFVTCEMDKNIIRQGFQKNSSICLATVRPITEGQVLQQCWVKEFEDNLIINKVELFVKYRYFSVPLFNSKGIFESEKIIKIGSSFNR